MLAKQISDICQKVKTIAKFPWQLNLVCDVCEAALAHDPLLLVHLVQLLRHRLVQALLVAVLLGPRLHHGAPPPHLPHNRGEEAELRVCVRHDAPALLHRCENISTIYSGVLAAPQRWMNFYPLGIYKFRCWRRIVLFFCRYFVFLLFCSSPWFSLQASESQSVFLSLYV